MNSKRDEELMNFVGNAEKNLIQAAEPTPCVMISEENWKSIVRTLDQQLKALDRIALILKGLITTEQMEECQSQIEMIHINHEKSWLKDLTQEAESMKTDLTSQAGKMNEIYAMALDKTKQELKTEMQQYSDKLYHRLMLPCLITTLLSAVLTLWLTLQM